MTGNVCEKHGVPQWCPDGVCRWCEPAVPAPHNFPARDVCDECGMTGAQIAAIADGGRVGCGNQVTFREPPVVGIRPLPIPNPINEPLLSNEEVDKLRTASDFGTGLAEKLRRLYPKPPSAIADPMYGESPAVTARRDAIELEKWKRAAQVRAQLPTPEDKDTFAPWPRTTCACGSHPLTSTEILTAAVYRVGNRTHGYERCVTEREC